MALQSKKITSIILMVILILILILILISTFPQVNPLTCQCSGVSDDNRKIKFKHKSPSKVQ